MHYLSSFPSQTALPPSSRLADFTTRGRDISLCHSLSATNQHIFLNTGLHYATQTTKSIPRLLYPIKLELLCAKMAQSSHLSSWKTPRYYFGHSCTCSSEYTSLYVPQLILAGPEGHGSGMYSLSPGYHVSTFCRHQLLIMSSITLLTPAFTQGPTGLATNSLVKSDFSNSPHVLKAYRPCS